MENQKKNTISVLEGLIEINNDGNHGYKLAADKIENLEYQTLFHSYAQQRAQFAAELEREANLLGRDVDPGESFLSTLHRGWINIKAAVTGGSSEAILAECQTGDKAAIEAYEKALNTNDLPVNVETILRKQYTAIQEAYTRVKTFKEIAS
jgi:uncharacterized protein (TIGR02284 family)